MATLEYRADSTIISFACLLLGVYHATHDDSTCGNSPDTTTCRMHMLWSLHVETRDLVVYTQFFLICKLCASLLK